MISNPFAAITVCDLEAIIRRHVPDFVELSDRDARILGQVLIEWADR